MNLQRKIQFTEAAAVHLRELEQNPASAGVLKQVRKTLKFLEQNPAHPSLHTHEYSSLRGANDERVFEAYAQNQTPGAYRVFFHYGPDQTVAGRRVPVLTIVAITPHPS
jgi:hypothetical protein